MAKAKKWYESIIILRPNLAEGEINAIVEKVSGIIVQEGGEIAKTENWGKKKLAYEVRKEKKGHFTFFHFESEPAVLPSLDHYYKVTEGIIKFLTVKGEAPKVEVVEEESTESDSGVTEDKKSSEAETAASTTASKE